MNEKIPLEELIDRVLQTHHSIRLFQKIVSVSRQQDSYSVDQLGEDAMPSEKLRDVLEQALRLGRWSFLAKKPQSENQPSGDIDRMQTLLDDI